MNVRKVVAGSVLAAGVGVAGLAGAGAASAGPNNWHPGDGTWQPGSAIATFNTNVSASLANSNRLFNGNLNGNTFNVLSGNKVGVLNGAFSNNILNTGADSFNTTTQRFTNSFNTHTVTVTNNGDSGKKPPKPHGDK